MSKETRGATELTQQQAESWLEEWQPILRLCDWNISVQVVRGREVDNDHGQCWLSRQEKVARIKLKMPGDHDETQSTPYNAEHTLIHELIELHFDVFKTEKKGFKHNAQELAINMLADALLKARLLPAK